MTHSPSTVLHWNWVPHDWANAVQLALWIALGTALIALASDIPKAFENRSVWRRAMLIGFLALAARLVVPLLPFNWHSGVLNVDLGGPIYSKDTTYMPFPNQLITFTLGFHGILAFNILTCIASAILAWHVARRVGYGERVALLLGLGIALTPMYVRLSSSDSTHMLALPLWWLAALAMQRLVDGTGGRIDQVLLVTSIAVACPIRIEAGLTMPAVTLLVARDFAGLRRAWEARRRWLPPLVLGLLVGMACNAAHHGGSWQYRLGQFNVIVFAVQMIARVLFLASPDPFGWIPAIYVFVIWYYLWSRWKQGDRAEVAATVLPFVLFSIPYAYSGTAIGTELPATAYGITIDMFLLLAAAKGTALVYERLRERMVNVELRWRVVAAVAAALILFGSFAIPYRRTYAYMEEFAFLSRSLPRGKAKILAIWDPVCPGGDYDCCLALPYPTFVGDFPELEWHILGNDDVGDALADLDFDYYYPGSLMAVDVDNLNSWFIGRLFPDDEMNARQQAALRELRSIDETIRTRYPLEAYRQESMPAHTFSWAPFRDDRMTLTLYRRVAEQ